MPGNVTYNYFLHGERYYTFILPLLIVVILITLMFIIYLLSERKKIRWGIFLELFLIIAILLGHLYYGKYYELVKQIYPNIRIVQPTILGYKSYSLERIQYYKKIQNRDSIEELGFYKSKEVSQAVTYLGEMENKYFFRYYDSVFYLNERVFFESVANTTLKGVQYHLNNKKFEDIGFLEETNFFLDGLYVPLSEKDLQFDASQYLEPRDFETKQEKWAVLDRPPF